jgi:hypothetical protein
MVTVYSIQSPFLTPVETSAAASEGEAVKTETIRTVRIKVHAQASFFMLCTARKPELTG